MSVFDIGERCWLAYYYDWSSFRVFPTEIEALRWAVDHSPVGVVPLAWGQDPREAAK